jgi:hypothetical protein
MNKKAGFGKSPGKSDSDNHGKTQEQKTDKPVSIHKQRLLFQVIKYEGYQIAV